jgi:YidC/Oxa1 family membrane protein insertase
MNNNKNIHIATLVSVAILLGWTWFYEKPRIENQERQKKLISKENFSEKNSNNSQDLKISNNTNNNKFESVAGANKNDEKNINLKGRDEALESSQANRIKINTPSLHGSVSLVGAKFDDLTLANFYKKLDKKEEVVLFAPVESKERYFADFGWISSDPNFEVPNPETLWSPSSKVLSVDSPISLSWKNKRGIEFVINISLDEKYMFTIEQIVKNNSKENIAIAPYGRINRILNNRGQSNYILHEGAIGSFAGVLHELNYDKMIKNKNKSFSEAGDSGSWLGITDKYWLSAIIPDKSLSYEANFKHELKNQNHIFAVNFVSKEFELKPQEQTKISQHLFAGAKKVKLLDQYSQDLNIKLFDLAVDFGWFYFLTKPFFFIVEFLYSLLGNFGLAILAMTVFVKLALFPMANKSYMAIARVKKLQPKIDALKEKYKDDKLAMNREVMNMYKKEKINPAAGCLPILIQIPVFFALYKVLFVTLDMRHAEFYGWIKDLSAPDPTSIFNLFGLLPFEVSSSFTIGVWPILMGITMIIQQRMSPPASDPMQTKVLKWMPYILTFVLAAFPAGLVIYWTWSNMLSILQQFYITKRNS